MPLASLVWLLASPPADPEPASSETVVVAPVEDQPELETTAPNDDQLEPAPEPTPEPAPEAEPEHTWQASVHVDVAYGFNSSWPENHVYRGMYTNPRTNELAVNNVGAFVRHALRDDEPWLFELGFHAGASVDALTQSEPIPGGPDGKFAGAEVFKYIALANAGFALRKSKTVFAAGVFESPMGIGSFWTFNNWNYTTTWESNIVPYYLAGPKIAQPLPGNVEIAAWFVNGFQSYADLNSVPSGLVSLTWARPPTPVASPRTGHTALTLATQVYFGPERPSLVPRDWLVYWDTWVSWDFDDHFSLAAVWDFGVDRPGRPENLQQMYTGGAVFARGTVFEGKVARIDLAVRPEASWDRDGRFFGVEQWLISATGTANMWLYDHLLLRLEYRYDHSTADDGFFYTQDLTADDDANLATSQHIVFLSLTAWWDFWFGGKRARKDAG